MPKPHMKTMRSRAAGALLVAMATLGTQATHAADAPDVPPYVQLARDFLGNTRAEDNHYVDRGVMYTKVPGDFLSSRWAVNTDCKGFVSEVIRRTYSFRPSFSGRSLGKGESSIVDWVAGAEKGEVFDQVKDVADLRVGDFALWSHEALADNARGHIVMIDRAPRRLERSRMEGLEQWEIYVIDSTGHAHSTDDTRYVKGAGQQREGYGVDGRSPNGVGSGRMYLYADAEGNVKAVSNGFQKSTIQTTWHIVLARLRPPR